MAINKKITTTAALNATPIKSIFLSKSMLAGSKGRKDSKEALLISESSISLEAKTIFSKVAVYLYS